MEGKVRANERRTRKLKDIRKKFWREVTVGDNHIRAVNFCKAIFFFLFLRQNHNVESFVKLNFTLSKKEKEKQKLVSQSLRFDWTLQAGNRGRQTWLRPPSTSTHTSSQFFVWWIGGPRKAQFLGFVIRFGFFFFF